MNEDALNLEIRKYLKQFGITAQREFEHGVLKAVEGGAVGVGDSLAIKLTLEVTGIGLKHCIEGQIPLE